MNDVFISYSRRDKVFTQKLYEALKAANRIVWADWDSIPAASDWDAEIKQGIQETNSVLFVLSPEWIKSNECRKEMIHAVQMGKRLFPILYLPVDPNDVPPELAKINWVYMRDSDDFDKGFQTLCSAMDTDLDWIKTHTRIQVRALEWEKKKRDHSFVLRGNDLTEGEQFIAGAANKSPVPTSLQSEYILASRTDATKRQRQTLVGVTVALVVSITLGVVAFFQRQEAKNQARIALARQLASQAQYLNLSRSSKQMIAALLDIQSLRLFPNTDAANFLINDNLSAYTVNRINDNYSVNSIVFSPDGQRLISGGCDNFDKDYSCLQGFVRILETATKKEIMHIPLDGNVTSIAVSPNDVYMASGGMDKTIHVWMIATGTEVAHTKHDEYVTSVAFSPDGMYVASGSVDGTARIWKSVTGAPIRVIPHKEQVHSVAFSPDGKHLVSSSGSNNIRIWDIDSGNIIIRMMYEDNSGDNLFDVVSSVAFSPDGNYVASGSDDNTARVWDATSGSEISRMTHDGNVVGVGFSPDGKYVISGSLDHTARVWEAVSGHEIFRMTHDDFVTSMAFSQDGKYVVSGSDDYTIRVWGLPPRSEFARVTNYPNPVAFSPDWKYVAMTGANNTVYVREISTGKEVAEKPHNEAVTTLEFSPDGMYLTSGSADYTTRIWVIDTELDIAQITHSSDISIVVFSPDGKFIASGSADRTIHIWQIDKRKEISSINYADNGGTATFDAIQAIAFSPDGRYIVSGSCDVEAELPELACKVGSARVWEVATGNEVSKVIYDDYVSSVTFSPDGKYVVSGSWDKTARVWEASTGKEIARTTHADLVTSVGFSPDGKYVVSGSWDQTARVWEATTGKEISHITHDNLVNSVAFVPGVLVFGEGGKYIASGSDDKTARIWESATGKEVARMIHDDAVIYITFSADGKHIISGSALTTRVWIWQPDNIIATACAAMPRNLTYIEWKQFIGDALPYPSKQEEATCPNLPIEPEVTVTPAVSP